MSYVGGKIKSAKFIVDMLNRHEFNHLPYLEPFLDIAQSVLES